MRSEVRQNWVRRYVLLFDRMAVATAIDGRLLGVSVALLQPEQNNSDSASTTDELLTNTELVTGPEKEIELDAKDNAKLAAAVNLATPTASCLRIGMSILRPGFA